MQLPYLSAHSRGAFIKCVKQTSKYFQLVLSVNKNNNNKRRMLCLMFLFSHLFYKTPLFTKEK